MRTNAVKIAGSEVGVIKSLRGLMVEIQITGERPDVKELLIVENHPEVFLEVSLFKTDTAVCINLTNSQVLCCGQKVSRSNTKVTVPVGPKTLGRVFSALGEPLDNGPALNDNRRAISEPSGTKNYHKGKKLIKLGTAGIDGGGFEKNNSVLS